MEDYKSRLKREHSNLAININKIDLFTTREVFSELSTAKKALIEIQRSTMASYLSVLEARMLLDETDG